MYSAEVLDHFQNPRNTGEVPNPSASAELENPACGDVLRLSLRVENRKVAEIRFLAQGCVAAMACASALTVAVTGMGVDEAQRLRREDLLRMVGGLPAESTHASYLAMETLQAVLQQLPVPGD